MIRKADINLKKNNPLTIINLVAIAVIFVFAIIDFIFGLQSLSDGKLFFGSYALSMFLTMIVYLVIATLMTLKGKSVGSSVFLLITLVLDQGKGFFTMLANNSLNFGAFYAYQLLIYLAIAVLFIVFICLEVKEQKLPHPAFVKPRMLVYALILGGIIFAVNITFTLLYVAFLFLLLAYFDEEELLPLVGLSYALIAPFTFVHLFIRIADGATVTLYQFMNALLLLGLLVITIIVMIKPDIFTLKPKKVIESEVTTVEEAKEEPEVKEEVSDEVKETANETETQVEAEDEPVVDEEKDEPLTNDDDKVVE